MCLARMRPRPPRAREGACMGYNKLNPLEKEFLIKLYRRGTVEYCG